MVAQPAFEPYLHGAHVDCGARVVAVPPGKDFAFPLDGMLRAITPNTRIVYVNNPNNPSGQPIAKDAIRQIARAAAHALVFVDEAYQDFLGELGNGWGSGWAYAFLSYAGPCWELS